MTVDPGRATTWLRLEGWMAGLLSVGAYTLLSLGGWIFFVLLFLLPDVSYGLKFPTFLHETHLGRIGRGVAR